VWNKKITGLLHTVLYLRISAYLLHAIAGNLFGLLKTEHQ